MPRKKLTKAQVKRKLKLTAGQLYDLMLDKIGHSESNEPISVNVLLDLQKKINSALKRVK